MHVIAAMLSSCCKCLCKQCFCDVNWHKKLPSASCWKSHIMHAADIADASKLMSRSALPFQMLMLALSANAVSSTDARPHVLSSHVEFMFSLDNACDVHVKWCWPVHAMQCFVIWAYQADKVIWHASKIIVSYWPAVVACIFIFHIMTAGQSLVVVLITPITLHSV